MVRSEDLNVHLCQQALEEVCVFPCIVETMCLQQLPFWVDIIIYVLPHGKVVGTEECSSCERRHEHWGWHVLHHPRA